MAIEAPLLVSKSVFACKAEATTGTAVALAGADAVFNVFNPVYREESQTEERQGQGSSTELARVASGLKSTMTFTTELFGSGTAETPTPSWATSLLAASAFKQSTDLFTLQDLSTAFYPSHTMGLYQDGELKRMAGALGKVTFRLSAGGKGMADWEYWGASVDPEDAALITPTYPTIIPPRWAGTTNTIGGATVNSADVVITVENQLVMRELAGKSSGYHSACIAKHRVTVSLALEAVLLATKNWRTAFLTSATSALSLVLGTTAGNIITIAAPALSLTDPPSDESKNDIRTRRLNFVATRGSAAGNDALSITFS